MLEFFSLIYEYISSFLSGVIWIITNVPLMLDLVFGTAVYMPDFFVPFLRIFLALAALFLVIKLL